jgi:hypothetical protein
MQDVYKDEESGITEEDVFEEPLNFYVNLDCNEKARKPAEATEEAEQESDPEEFF